MIVASAGRHCLEEFGVFSFVGMSAEGTPELTMCTPLERPAYIHTPPRNLSCQFHNTKNFPSYLPTYNQI